MVLIRNSVTNININYIGPTKRKYYKFTIRYYTTGCVGDTTYTLKYCTVIMRDTVLNTAHIVVLYLKVLHTVRDT